MNKLCKELWKYFKKELGKALNVKVKNLIVYETCDKSKITWHRFVFDNIKDLELFKENRVKTLEYYKAFYEDLDSKTPSIYGLY